jgi:hypothetical protein
MICGAGSGEPLGLQPDSFVVRVIYPGNVQSGRSTICDCVIADECRSARTMRPGGRARGRSSFEDARRCRQRDGNPATQGPARDYPHTQTRRARGPYGV